MSQTTLLPNDAVVAARIEPSRVIETILELLPQTENLVVVIGASPVEAFWLNIVRDDCRRVAKRLQVQSCSGLSFDQTLERCATLPPNSVVLYTFIAVDAKGVPQWEEGAITRLHNVSTAPMFGIFETQLGQGIVGGPLMDMEELAHTTARVAMRILDGEPPGTIRTAVQQMGVPQFDWRELRRWGISDARLPAGSVLRFRQPGPWERYRWLAGGGILLGALETGLIVALLVNRKKRRQGEAMATLIAELSSRFVNLPADHVDAEIEAAQHRICQSLRFDLCALWQWPNDHAHDMVLTHVCRSVDGPAIPKLMSAQEYFPWCLQEVTAKRRVALASLHDAPAEASRDVETFRKFGIQADLTIPLTTGDEPTLGAVSFNTIGTARGWTAEVINRLEVVAQIFANALARKRADQDLRESEARLALAADAAAAGLWRLDLASNSFWLTTKTRELFGFGADEIITFDRFVAFVHPDDRDLLRQTLRHVVQSQGEIQLEYRAVRPDGRLLWMQSKGRLHANGSGQPEYLMGVTVDITQRRLAEDAQRESDARLASAVEVAMLGFYEIGVDNGRIFLDERLRSLLGITPSEDHRVHEFWMEHIHPDDRERVRELSGNSLTDSRRAVSVEYRYMHPERGILWFSHVSRADHDATGKVVRRLGVIRDTTEQRRAELEIQHLRGNLAHLNRVNTLGALSGSLAHELNQPLGVILSNAQAAQHLLTREPPDTAEVQAILTDIVTADRRAGEVIERLRALFKGGQPSLQALSLNDVIEEVLRLTRAELLGRGITALRDLAPDLPLVLADRVQLQQLVLNLILNAADAMANQPAGRRRLHLQTRFHLDHVRAAVRDEGEGLPDDVERLFQPLHTTKPQGLGMGLAICRSIVGAHGGRLWAERPPEGGAVFHFELPLDGITDRS